jgi:hypothetical protein
VLLDDVLEPLQGTTGLAGPGVNTTFSRGFAAGKDGKSSNVLRATGRDGGVFVRGVDVLPTAEVHRAAGRDVVELIFIAPSRCVIGARLTGRDAATASIRFQTLCVLTFGRPCADDLSRKILERCVD